MLELYYLLSKLNKPLQQVHNSSYLQDLIKKVVEWCLEREVTITPGVATPTTINMALHYGLNILKFFPAEAMGGVKTLKAIGAPFVGVRFIPTGGINVNNLATYLSLPMVYACGGSWMVKRDMISAGDFGTITKLAKEALKLVKEII